MWFPCLITCAQRSALGPSRSDRLALAGAKKCVRRAEGLLSNQRAPLLCPGLGIGTECSPGCRSELLCQVVEVQDLEDLLLPEQAWGERRPHEIPHLRRAIVGHVPSYAARLYSTRPRNGPQPSRPGGAGRSRRRPHPCRVIHPRVHRVAPRRLAALGPCGGRIARWSARWNARPGEKPWQGRRLRRAGPR